MTEKTGSESPLYVVEDLPAFDNRQAWSGVLPGSADSLRMKVGDDEELYISRTRPRERLSRHSAEMGAIREVIETGTLGLVGSLWKVASLRDQLKLEYGRLLPQDAPQYQSLQDLETLDTFVERAEVSSRIIRAAGYIAMRPNLWVVTRLTNRGEGADKRILAARLKGLAGHSSESMPMRVLPVVVGKNGLHSVLKNTQRDPANKIRPNVLDVIESKRLH